MTELDRSPRTTYGLSRIARIRAMFRAETAYLERQKAEDEYYDILRQWGQALGTAEEAELDRTVSLKFRARIDAVARERECRSDAYPFGAPELAAAEDYLAAAIRDPRLQTKGDRALDSAAERVYGFISDHCLGYNDQYSKDRNCSFGRPKIW